MFLLHTDWFKCNLKQVTARWIKRKFIIFLLYWSRVQRWTNYLDKFSRTVPARAAREQDRLSRKHSLGHAEFTLSVSRRTTQAFWTRPGKPSPRQISGIISQFHDRRDCCDSIRLFTPANETGIVLMRCITARLSMVGTNQLRWSSDRTPHSWTASWIELNDMVWASRGSLFQLTWLSLTMECCRWRRQADFSSGASRLQSYTHEPACSSWESYKSIQQLLPNIFFCKSLVPSVEIAV